MLAALASLSPGFELTARDAPKMQKNLDPSVAFIFKPTEDEQQELIELAGDAVCDVSTAKELLGSAEIIYRVTFDRRSGQTNRAFSIHGIKLPDHSRTNPRRFVRAAATTRRQSEDPSRH